jgi:hypothetical protein
MATVEDYQNISLEDKLRRTAHHEAGHVVVAAQQGVPLRVEGISVDPVGEGLACYWKAPDSNDVSRKSVIRATFAGFDAEERFCRLHSLPILEGLPIICSPDWVEARTQASRLDDIGPYASVNEIHDFLHEESRHLVVQYWHVIEARAAVLLVKEWEPLQTLKSGGIWSQQATAKYVKGNELVTLLQLFDLPAICRSN